jgi:hypothetical protein
MPRRHSSDCELTLGYTVQLWYRAPDRLGDTYLTGISAYSPAYVLVFRYASHIRWLVPVLTPAVPFIAITPGAMSVSLWNRRGFEASLVGMALPISAVYPVIWRRVTLAETE